MTGKKGVCVGGGLGYVSISEEVPGYMGTGTWPEWAGGGCTTAVELAFETETPDFLISLLIDARLLPDLLFERDFPCLEPLLVRPLAPPLVLRPLSRLCRVRAVEAPSDARLWAGGESTAGAAIVVI